VENWLVRVGFINENLSLILNHSIAEVFVIRFGMIPNLRTRNNSSLNNNSFSNSIVLSIKIDCLGERGVLSIAMPESTLEKIVSGDEAWAGQ
jgi:hypothetical protein